jgi:hypothetical protein
VTSTTTVTDDNWHHITVTFDGSDVKLYVNNTLESTQSKTFSGSIVQNIPFHIGAVNNKGSAILHLDGKMDEIRIYDRALSAYEVLQLYLGYDTEEDFFNTLATADAYWSMDTDGTDDSGNGNTLTINGATNAAAKLNNGYSFDGSNDYVTPGNLSSLTVKSISWWGYIDSTGTWNGNSVFFMTVPDLSNFMPFRIYNTDLRFQLVSGGSSVWYSGIIPFTTRDTWVHFVATCDGTTGKVYINGVLTASFASTATDFMANNGNFDLGRNSYDSVYSKIKLDEVGLYSHTLLPDEVAALYNGGVGFNPYASTGYPNDVNGVASASIGKVNGVETGNISKVNGV